MDIPLLISALLIGVLASSFFSALSRPASVARAIPRGRRAQGRVRGLDFQRSLSKLKAKTRDRDAPVPGGGPGGPGGGSPRTSCEAFQAAC
jgi:hypothetical protein